MNYEQLNEEKILQIERELYAGEMPAHNKEVLRAQMRRDDMAYLREINRVDSNTGHDDQ